MMIVPAPYSWVRVFFLLPLAGIAVAILVGLIVLLVKRPKAGLVVIGVLGALFVFAGLFFFTARVAFQPQAVRVYNVPQQIIAPTSAGPSQWKQNTWPYNVPQQIITPTLPMRSLPPNADFQGVIEPNVIELAQSPATSTMLQTTMPSQSWVDDWPAFSNSVGRSRYLRGESSDTCATQAEAQSEAFTSAAVQLFPAVRAKAMANLGREVSAVILREQLYAALVSGEIVRNSSIKSIDRPYGKLWKKYVLVDSSPAVIDQLARRSVEAMRAKGNADMQYWAGIIGMSVVIVLLYAFLNAATQGYFVWRLRCAAAVAAIAAVLAIFALA